ncbi:hypothetical protein Tco_0154106 [Tanacetum coccineum]
MMEADIELAQRLQEEQGEITIVERSRLFVELMNKRKKHFAKLRAEEIRRKPPTKAQKRNKMSTYLKNMAGYKHSQLKSKSYDEIQKLFDGIDREDLETLWKLVKAKHENTRPEDDYERVLWGDLKWLEIDNFMLLKNNPLTPITISNMLNKKLQADCWNEMCYQLLKLMTKQEKGQ